MKRFVCVLLTALLLSPVAVPALAYDTTNEAMQAYDEIEASVIADFGIDDMTGVANFPESFGGAWIGSGNYLVIGLTELSDENRQFYAVRCQNPEILMFAELKYGLWRLLSIQTEISADFSGQDARTDFYLESAVISLETNSVTVTVMQGGMDAAEEYFSAKYSDAVILVEGGALASAPTGDGEQAIVLDLWLVIVIILVFLLVLALIVFLTVRVIKLRSRRRGVK